MKMVYTQNQMTAVTPAGNGFPEWSYSSSYRFISSNDQSITVQADKGTNGEEKPKPFVIHFATPDRYWIEIEVSLPDFPIDTSNWKEFFDRVSED